ncbi:XRE family transcriptional regulator [Salinimicrobium sp. GXAS 041]|uniref:XRE family transcriptional regulator n=1 Tax=Salinimicrobium sp. GXAS 041 TaxID=3400806 RepID=UPI003C77A0C3
MEYKIEIAKRLKELRKRKKFSQAYVAQNSFISQAAYSLIENSQNGIIAEHIIRLSQLYKVTTDYILRGDSMLLKISSANGFIPLVNKEAHAGFVENIDDLDFLDNLDWFKIPGVNPAHEQKLFEVDGESMMSTLLPGDILICQQYNQFDKLLDGTLALLVTSKEIVVKRLRVENNSDDFLILVSDNPNEEEGAVKLKKSQIKQAFVVKGKITSILLPYQNFTSQKKIDTMEEAIEFLKKELYKVTKKLNALGN